jgi:uncharacterized membrane protein YkvA (DUF1232 family)
MAASPVPTYLSMAFTWWAARSLGQDTKDLQRRFWKKLGRYAVLIPFTDDLLAAYYCALDRETPHAVRGALIAAVGYFVLPADSIPDLVPALGFTDDAAVLAATIKYVSSHIKPEHREAAQARLARFYPFKGAR